jgi:phosphoribosylglycinamide formyltransferase 1
LNGGHARQSIVVLISGRGSNMVALAKQSRASEAAYSIAGVLSDLPEAHGLKSASDLGIHSQAIPAPKGIKRADYDRSLAAAIRAHEPKLIVLAGFMRILSPEFVAEFSGRMLNIHPSLLPKYPGLHTHQRALQAHDSEHGATVHFVTEQLDGGPAVIQARVPVEPSDTEDSLAARVQVQEHRIYPLAVNWFCAGRLQFVGGQAWLDGRVLGVPVQYSDDDPTREMR